MNNELRRLSVVGANASALVALTADVQGPLRFVAVLPFLLIGPGLAWTWFLRVASVPAELLLAVVLSLSIETLAAVGLAAFGTWSPGATVVAMAGAAVAGLAVNSLRAPRTA